MSDGLTDSFRSALAIERRNLLFRSVADYLQDHEDCEKLSTAANDVMAYEKWLVGPSSDSREEAAKAFLSRLRDKSIPDWVRLLTFTVRFASPQGIDELRNLSPFRGKLLLLAARGVLTSLASVRDLDFAVMRELAGSQDGTTHLVVLECTSFQSYETEI